MRNERWKAGQCSRSSARRSRSPARAAIRPQAPEQTASFQASKPSMPGVMKTGSVLAMMRWSKAPRACSAIHCHSSSSTMSRRPSASTRAARESITTRRVLPKSRWKANLLDVGSRSKARASSRKRGPPSSRPASSASSGSCDELRRRQVADVLVEPVRHEGAGDALLPPVGGAHLLHPGLRDVPVVVHVVVVEDHRARHRREQPADVRVAPGLAVEPRVLLEVRDLLARRRARVAAAADERARRLRGLVGVDLVAEQEQAVGPLLGCRTAGGARAPRARRCRSRAGARPAAACRARARGRPRGTSRRRAARGARPRACGSPTAAGRRPAARRSAPSRCTSYGRTAPGSRSLSTTSA